eukprot:Gb_39324 [translate_table: standard]
MAHPQSPRFVQESPEPYTVTPGDQLQSQWPTPTSPHTVPPKSTTAGKNLDVNSQDDQTPQKMSVLGKVKDKAKKIKASIAKHVHDSRSAPDHREEEEEKEEEEESSPPHAPSNESSEKVTKPVSVSHNSREPKSEINLESNLGAGGHDSRAAEDDEKRQQEFPAARGQDPARVSPVSSMAYPDEKMERRDGTRPEPADSEKSKLEKFEHASSDTPDSFPASTNDDVKMEAGDSGASPRSAKNVTFLDANSEGFPGDSGVSPQTDKNVTFLDANSEGFPESSHQLRERDTSEVVGGDSMNPNAVMPEEIINPDKEESRMERPLQPINEGRDSSGNDIVIKGQDQVSAEGGLPYDNRMAEEGISKGTESQLGPEKYLQLEKGQQPISEDTESQLGPEKDLQVEKGQQPISYEMEEAITDSNVSGIGSVKDHSMGFGEEARSEKALNEWSSEGGATYDEDTPGEPIFTHQEALHESKPSREGTQEGGATYAQDTPGEPIFTHQEALHESKPSREGTQEGGATYAEDKPGEPIFPYQEALHESKPSREGAQAHESLKTEEPAIAHENFKTEESAPAIAHEEDRSGGSSMVEKGDEIVGNKGPKEVLPMDLGGSRNAANSNAGSQGRMEEEEELADYQKPEEAAAGDKNNIQGIHETFPNAENEISPKVEQEATVQEEKKPKTEEEENDESKTSKLGHHDAGSAESKEARKNTVLDKLSPEDEHKAEEPSSEAITGAGSESTEISSGGSNGSKSENSGSSSPKEKGIVDRVSGLVSSFWKKPEQPEHPSVVK